MVMEVLLEEVEEGTSPERLIRFTSADNILYEADIVSFVILQTCWALERDGNEDYTAFQVSERTGETARQLMVAGWFTYDEFLGAWAASEVEGINEELKALTEEEA